MTQISICPSDHNNNKQLSHAIAVIAISISLRNSSFLRRRKASHQPVWPSVLRNIADHMVFSLVPLIKSQVILQQYNTALCSLNNATIETYMEVDKSNGFNLSSLNLALLQLVRLSGSGKDEPVNVFFRQLALLPEGHMFCRKPGICGIHLHAAQGFGGLNFWAAHAQMNVVPSQTNQ